MTLSVSYGPNHGLELIPTVFYMMYMQTTNILRYYMPADATNLGLPVLIIENMIFVSIYRLRLPHIHI